MRDNEWDGRERGEEYNECRVIVLASLSPVAISQVIFVCKRQVMQEEGVEERGQGVSYEACIVLMLLLFSKNKKHRDMQQETVAREEK